MLTADDLRRLSEKATSDGEPSSVREATQRMRKIEKLLKRSAQRGERSAIACDVVHYDATRMVRSAPLPAVQFSLPEDALEGSDLLVFTSLRDRGLKPVIKYWWDGGELDGFRICVSW